MDRRPVRVSSRVRAALLGLALAIAAGPAAAALIDFESIIHGEIVNTQIQGITIVASNPNRAGFDLAVGFDSALTTMTSDPDLQAISGGATPWSGGNLEGVELGKLLILQENNTGCEDGVSRCTDPDDEGRRPAGMISVIFDVPVIEFGFDLVDVENLTAENGSLVFTGVDEMGNAASALIPFMSFLDPTMLGDNTANRVAPLLAEDFGLASISQVDFNLGGSSGLDNFLFEPVPEPGTAALLGAGLALLALRRRRRS